MQIQDDRDGFKMIFSIWRLAKIWHTYKVLHFFFLRVKTYSHCGLEQTGMRIENHTKAINLTIVIGAAQLLTLRMPSYVPGHWGVIPSWHMHCAAKRFYLLCLIVLYWTSIGEFYILSTGFVAKGWIDEFDSVLPKLTFLTKVKIISLCTFWQFNKYVINCISISRTCLLKSHLNFLTFLFHIFLVNCLYQHSPGA
jgi:hypothetical protein